MLTRAAHWTGTIALIAIAAALAVYSVQLNYQYASWLFGSLGVGAPMLYAFGVAAADIGKLALPWVIAQQWIAGRRLAAAGMTILMIGLAAASIWALVSLGLQGREGIAGTARMQAATLADLKAERADLKAQLTTYGTVTAPDVIERQMQAMRFDRRWGSTAGCTHATRSASRAFCAAHGQLFSQLAGATKADQLRAQIASLNHRIATARTASGDATPYAAQVVLARLVGIDSDAIGGITLLGLAVLIEILALVMAAAAFEQIRQLITPPESHLDDPDGDDDFTDNDEPEHTESMADQPSLIRAAPRSSVTALRPRKQGLEGPLTPLANDVANSKPSVTQCNPKMTPLPGMVGNLALAPVAAPEGCIHQAPVSVPVLVPGDPCPIAFWDACVAPARNNRVSAADLFASYQAWCRDRDVQPLSQTAITRRIKAARNVRHRKSNGRKIYIGVELRKGE